MVVPLNRLAFEYLEKIPKSQEDMLSITDKIISILKRIIKINCRHRTLRLQKNISIIYIMATTQIVEMTF